MNERGRAIVLIGFMGAGKSTIGKLLAEKLRLPLHDTDAMMEAESGESISEIFRCEGEEVFRERETAALEKIPSEDCVIVTGGGIVLREENVARLQALGRVVWLEVDEETAYERVGYDGNRPLLQADNPREKIRELMRARRPLYEKAADLRVETVRAMPAETAAAILKQLNHDERVG